MASGAEKMLRRVGAKPIFTVFVRQSRHTKKLLDKNGEFTINVPRKGADVKQIMSVCGTKSGRDMNKIQELGLTLEDPQVISVPGIKELPITLECRVVYKQDQNLDFRKVRYHSSMTRNFD